MASKPCKYGCGTQLEWNTTENAFFEVETQKKHFPCPAFKKNTSNFKQVAQKVEQEITTNPSSFKKNDALGRVAELETQVQADIKDINSRLLRAEQAIQALVKEPSFKPASKLDKKHDDIEEEVMED